VLEQHGLAVTEALWQLDEATTAAWKAWVEPTYDEWRLADRIDRGWDAASRLGRRLIRLAGRSPP
jgi:hypothetical protein